MAGRPRLRLQNWLFTLAFVAIVAGTVAGFLVARADAVDAAEDEASMAATRAAGSLERELRKVVSGLGGAAAIVADDGSLDIEVFNAFGSDLVASGDVPGLVLVGVDRTGPGEMFPLLGAQPDETAGGRIGTDLGTDPAWAGTFHAGVRDREWALSGVVDLISTGEPGLELIRPLVDDGGGRMVRGFLAAGIPLADLEALAREEIGTSQAFALADGDTPIVGPAFDPGQPTTRVTVGASGERLSVVLGPPAAPDLSRAWVIVGIGAAGLAVMALLMFATVRQQRRMARTNELLTRAEERSRAVQEVAGQLARALSGGDIVTALVAHLPAAVEARSAMIATRNDAGQLEVLDLDDAGDVRSGQLLEIEETGSLVETTLMSGEPAWLSSPLGWRGDEPTDTLAAGGSALALLPLDADGVTGVLAVSYPKIRIFADDEKDLLETVGILAARALARGRQYDVEHDTALAFQRAALPDDLPAVDGLTIAARYRPAAQRATVGGDWYDVLVLDERRVVLVVGDVVGHGIVAAAAMGRLRTAFQAIAPLSADPGSMLAAMSKQVESIPDSFCTTAVCVVIDLEARSMTWCRAGHPPPLVLASGRSYLLDARGLPPLGVAPDAVPPVHARTLDAGDVVVLYTDGAIERRDESIDEGLHRIGVISEDLADLEPDEFSDALVAAMSADVHEDDLALLVVRFDGTTGSSPEPVAMSPGERLRQ